MPAGRRARRLRRRGEGEAGGGSVLSARLRRADDRRAESSRAQPDPVGCRAARYGLHQVAITGLDPGAEPSARRLASLATLVRRLGVRTVFFERLASARLAQTVAREAGVKTAVLDPIEGLTPSESAHGATYL